MLRPLPSHRFRPRPLPKPERNAPCPCGSGQKYKRCCREQPVPEIDSETVWSLAISHLDPKQIRAAVGAHAIPPLALADLADQLQETGYTGKAKSLLEPLFDGDLYALDERHEPALDKLCDIYNDLGHTRKKRALLERVTTGGGQALRAAAWQRFAVVHADEDNPKAAWDAFRQAQRAAPMHPALGTLEVTLLVSEGRDEEASARARFWHGKLARQGDVPSELLDFLAEVADNPSRALLAAGEDTAQLDRLASCIEAAGNRPLPVYTLDAEPIAYTQTDVKAQLRQRLAAMHIPDDEIELALQSIQSDPTFDTTDNPDDAASAQISLPFGPDEAADTGDDAPLYVMQPPQAVAAAEQQWREICPVGKPFSVSPMPIREDDPWATDEADTWLALLQDRPDALDSLDVIDDLRAMTLMHEMAGMPGVEQRYFVPLLERAVAIIDNALAQAPSDAELDWSVIENRPVLRLLCDYALWLYRSGQPVSALARFRQYLALNPSDNHGVRSLLVDMHLQAGADQEALALCACYPDDMEVEVVFGAVLAHYRLGDHETAAAALRHAHEANPYVVGMLRRARVRQPKISEYGITVGGKDEAWLYRESMRAVWVATDGLLNWTKRIVG